MFSICKMHPYALNDLNEYIQSGKLLYTFEFDSTSVKSTFYDVSLAKENKTKFFYNNNNLYLETLKTTDNNAFSIKLNFDKNIEFKFIANDINNSVEIECPLTDMLSNHSKKLYNKNVFFIDNNIVDALSFVDGIYKHILKTI